MLLYFISHIKQHLFAVTDGKVLLDQMANGTVLKIIYEKTLPYHPLNHKFKKNQK